VLLVFTVFLTLLTSVLAYATTRGARTVTAGFVRRAIRGLFEWIGSFACFLGVNVFLGVVIIVAVRGVTQRFIAVYDLDNPLLMILSAAQGFVFQLWWRRE
jgi:hypothetical protein